MHEQFLRELMVYQAETFNATNEIDSIKVKPVYGGNFEVKWGCFSYDGFEARLTLKAIDHNPNKYEFVTFNISTGDYTKEINGSGIADLFFNRSVLLVVIVSEYLAQLKEETDQGNFPSTIVYTALKGSSQGNELLLFVSQGFEASPGFYDYFFTFRRESDFLEKVQLMKANHPSAYELLVCDDNSSYQVIDLQKRLFREFDSYEELVEAINLGFAFDMYIPEIRAKYSSNLVHINSLTDYWKASKENRTRNISISNNPLD